jgi:nucleotide-binding universal stress UspA family protein
LAIEQTDMKIVVGVDGSAPSYRALEWALGEARARGVGVVLVHAFEFSGLAASQPYTSPDLLDAYREDAQALLDRVLDRARHLAPDVNVKAELQFGPAAAALVEAARGAVMLVVGSRGRGGFVGALLGSVSSACVHHATCPIVVVPPPERDGQPERHDEEDADGDPTDS